MLDMGKASAQLHMTTTARMINNPGMAHGGSISPLAESVRSRLEQPNTDTPGDMRSLRAPAASRARTVTTAHVFSQMPSAGLPVIRRATCGDNPMPRPVAGTCGSTQIGRGEG
ncbi:hypothetical protein Y717_11490 [Streptomyces scopuliridis RB72]|uniref:Uncharacterized protein n=1 Tax=Streptomyces scopuliridis RB72 TaxID=1440053 RepID=A0A2T7SNS8_9ACTN|nr:hypothetical protein Y717_11490 [Streptomyces scopuliridis RB72]